MKLKEDQVTGEPVVTEQPKLKNIYQSMSMIMSLLQPISKNKTNQFGGFKYRGIDDVMNALHGVMADAGVFVTIEVESREVVERQSSQGSALFYVTLFVNVRFNAEDSSYVQCRVVGTAMDSGDKADNKAMSVALKYACLQALMIPTEDMAEPDRDTYQVAAKQPERRPVTDGEWLAIVRRMRAGEKIQDKVRAAYLLTAEQEQNLTFYESQSNEF